MSQHTSTLPRSVLRSDESPELDQADEEADKASSPQHVPWRKVIIFVGCFVFLAAVASQGATAELPDVSWFPADYGAARSCPEGWPHFASRSALQASAPWAAYIASVYGAVPNDTAAYPLCTGDLWMFYTEELAAAGVTDMPPSVGRCPINGGTIAGQHYEQHSYLAPANVTWSWHPPPLVGERTGAYPPLEADSWVEVLHVGGISDEHVGAWFLQAPGSGVWFHVGKTIVFDDHADGHVYFGVTGVTGVNGTTGRGAIGLRNEAMCANASAAGFDSIQFVRHTCNMMYGQCRSSSSTGLNYFNIEVVSTKLAGIHACATATGESPLIRSGWKGARTCTCNNSIDFLNCQEVPPSRRARKSGDHWIMKRAGTAGAMNDLNGSSAMR